jgi:phage-related holin
MVPSNQFFDVKMLWCFGLSLVLSPLTALIQKYVFADWQFVGFLITLIFFDTVLGLVCALRQHHISSAGFGRVIIKIALYGVFLIVIHVLTNFKVDGEKSSLFSWFKSVGYGILLLREAISIVENICKLYPGLLPSWILQRLKDFDSSGKLIDNIPGASALSNPENNQA